MRAIWGGSGAGWVGGGVLRAAALVGAVWLSAAAPLLADDWPQWMGPQRDGVWREGGIVERFASNSLPVLWRTPVNPGYCGPAVVGGRLYLMDRIAGKMPERKKGDRSIPSVPGVERILCFDAATGTNLWAQSYEAGYRIGYPAGPRATPVVEGGRVYTLGAMGDLQCRNTSDGAAVWRVNFPTNYSLEQPPTWGWAASPLLDGDRLICLVGGSNSVVVAFDKHDGRELWRALNAPEVGYAPPMLYEAGGRRVLLIWHPDALAGLDPATGKVLWEQKYPVEGKPQRPEVTVATPRFDGHRVFVTSFYHGALMLDLGADGLTPRVAWNRRSTKESEFDQGLHTTITTPWIHEGHIYGVCGMGELRCLEGARGDRKWETYAATGGESGLFATAFFTEQAGRVWIWNDHGELILAALSPDGYREISRAKLLEPIENTRGRDVLWCAPAFANRCAYMHNGKELICVSLAAPGKAA